uniref:DNA-directed DNA/RNA polymerase mu n=1 Tax=Cynoglossus semilaevis TaxID=244447 RepID=A0A3P8VGN8_CYNSE
MYVLWLTQLHPAPFVHSFAFLILFEEVRKMGASRRAFLTQLGRKKGFHVEEILSETVTHIIAENNSGDEVRTWLNSQDRVGHQASLHLLDISWFTESMHSGHPVQILDRHRLQEEEQSDSEAAVFTMPSYACQRRTTMDNKNPILTDALSLLAENAELSNQDGRGVAFRRAAAVLKALPEAVTSMKQLKGLPCLGGHSQRVIKDILENGASDEVQSLRQSERYQALKVLTGIFGVGAKTADRWIRDGIHTLQQLRESGHTLTRTQQAGLEHYEDLNMPVSKAEADDISKIVEVVVDSVLPGSQVALTGGFRRGKQTGHDVDFLITHPEEGKEEGLMTKVVSLLDSKGFLLYQQMTRNSYVESEDAPALASFHMDRFERCFSIFKLPKDREESLKQLGSLYPKPAGGVCDGRAGEVLHRETSQSQGSHSEVQEEVKEPKSWRAIRVDLVVSPFSQFAFAQLGWTGSKLFERELRRWAGQEKRMSLNSHALYDSKQGKYLQATSEEEIFTHLGLEFIPPSERNA